MENLYDILGVGSSASPEEIKKAYRDKAKEHHPDKDGDSATFNQVAKAYDILSNKEKRSDYDQFGKTEPEQSNLISSAIQIFFEVVSRRPDDYSKELKESIDSLKEHARIKIESLKDDIERFQSVKDRIISGPKENDFLTAALDSKISVLERTVSQGNSELEKMDKIMDMFSGYEFKVNEPEEFSGYDVLSSSIRADGSTMTFRVNHG